MDLCIPEAYLKPCQMFVDTIVRLNVDTTSYDIVRRHLSTGEFLSEIVIKDFLLIIANVWQGPKNF